ncbi:MAG: DUF3800 domain-containing protein [Thaumarchaeota archaeon S15]|nr:DUF3800 domain-containing protein [Nitrososphaerota archaeon]RNJ71493.1 MAG: DUF3800 domain-containing protein [Thaumarchaeota archaeon S13]RNJ73201.1 MAG: DUF3800 domain-containing protein [Thaumarchaeota archaeon S15]
MVEWVAHVDESGSWPGAGGGQGRFVLACIAGSQEATAAVAEGIRRLKLELVPGIDPADWELHAGDMFHGRGGSLLGSLGMEKKMAIMRKVVDIVCDNDVVAFTITVTGVRTRGKSAGGTKIVEHAVALMVERLERLARGRGVVTVRVVSDNVPEGQRLAMERALGRATTRRPPPRGMPLAVEGIEFADSLHRAALQAADAAAYIANRHAGGDELFGEMFRDIERKACRPAKGAG